MITPSFLALAISGLLIFIAGLNYSNYSGKIDSIQRINLLLFFASSIAFHGLLHLGAEIFYGFNPLEGRFQFSKK
jgi:hypothetical protein